MTRFSIHIGDWSGDGHGKMETFTVKSNLSLEEVREAYFAARERFPEDMNPENFMSRYEDRYIPEETREAAAHYGYTLPGEDLFTPEDMCDYLCWFIQQGNRNLELELEKPLPSFSFYGTDSKGRHIGFIGYGLF